MPSLAASGPNAEQIQYWNETAGPKWVARQELLDTQIRPLGEHAMERAALRAGDSVLDVGCGCGSTSLELARRVGAGGRVVGIDISTVMLDAARAAAEQARLAQVRFENADAQTHGFEPASFDVVYSRFGVMFFIDPQAAFANLRRALRDGGRLSFVCWQILPANPWMAVPMMAALQHLPMPTLPAPDAPGPFAFADPERVRAILEKAGFAAIAIEPVSEKLSIGGGRDLDATVEFLLQVGPLGTALREAGADVAARVAASVRESLVPYSTDRGVWMDSAAWLVTARA